MRSRVLRYVALLAIAPTFSWADVVELKTGQRVEGTLVQTTSSGVVVEVGGQKITFDRDKVRAIYFGTAPVASDQAKPLPAKEALRALKALQSSVRAGVTNRDYMTRVADTKIVVDRSLEARDAVSDNARNSIQAAMNYYQTAGTVWNANLRERYTYSVREEDAPRECRHYQPYLSAFRAGMGRSLPERMATMLVLDSGILQVYWSCASDKITEVEEVLKSKSTD